MPEYRRKINYQVTKKNDGQLRKDSTINDTSNLGKAYDKVPKIYLSFFPSNNAIACKMATMPYTTVKEQNQPYIDGQTYLGAADSSYLASKLKSLPPLVVNPDGGTSFGDFDCLESTDCLALEAYARIGIVCALKVDSNYFCHIMLSHKEWYIPDRGIILLMSPKGEIMQWMFSDGSLTQGNPHGNIYRMFTILAGHQIKVEEYTSGDNSDQYEFHASYQFNNNKFTLQKRKLRILSRQ